jgi:hypothetical protein
MRVTNDLLICKSNCDAILRHYKLPHLHAVATLYDRTMYLELPDFMKALEKLVPDWFSRWDFVHNHGTTALRGWRENVPMYSLQIIQHDTHILEMDFDIFNPNYGVLPAAGHLLEIMWPGKTDPYKILHGLERRGVGKEMMV